MHDIFFKYLTASEEDQHWGLYLTVAGTSKIPPNSPYPPKKHPSSYQFSWEKGRVLQEFQMTYVTSGQGIFENRYGSYDVKPGTLFFLFPGEWHRYRPDKNSGWDEYYLGFKGVFCERIMAQRHFNKENPVSVIGYHEPILSRLQQAIELVDEESAGFQQICAGLIIGILGFFVAHRKREYFSGKQIEKIIQEARFYLREHSHQDVDVQQLAESLNVGYSYFRRMFKSYTGISPGQYHLQLRIQKAQEMILYSNKSIKEIAIDLGFESVYYFSRLFKQKAGVPPSQFREVK